MVRHRLLYLGTLVWVLALPAPSGAVDIFRLSAPPGAIYGNASFEQTTVVAVEVTIEHEGSAVEHWFLGATAGNGSFAERTLTHSSLSEELSYQLYPAPPEGERAILAGPGAPGFSIDNVVTSGDFATSTDTPRLVTYRIYKEIPSGQFKRSGTYTDTVELQLYKGVPADEESHTLADSATVTVTARMARILDLFALPEPGIRTMDLTISVTDRLLAIVHERSNSDTGYEVRITSANLAAAGSGTEPFLAQREGPGTLSYSLKYGGVAATPWTNGTTVVTDTTDTAGPDWVTRNLAITYSGSPTLPAGYYEDNLIITIFAQ